ncbi:MAG: hypothetical protein V1674_01260 [Candidatus Omnitrophota bacterium]
MTPFRLERYFDIALLRQAQNSTSSEIEGRFSGQPKYCGYVVEGAEAPAECPACKHPQSFYEVLAENF